MDKLCSTWVSLTALVRKDLVEEFRTRYAINALLMFAMVSLVVVSFSVGANALSSELHGALLWVIIFFTSMSGLGRSFVKEEEKNTGLALRMAASSDVIFLGKLLFNAIIMVTVSSLVLVLYTVLMNPHIGNAALLVTTVLLGSLAMAGATTILAAVVSKAANQGTLLPVLSLPVLMPLLLIAVETTRLALEGASFRQTFGMLSFLVSYGIVIVTVSFLLFDFVWS